MAIAQEVLDRYDEVKERFKLLKHIEVEVNPFYMENEVYYKVNSINKKDSPTYYDLIGVKSGKDIVSGITPHDIRRRIDSNTIKLVSKLYDDEDDVLQVYRWLLRGMRLYQAVLKAHTLKEAKNLRLR